MRTAQLKEGSPACELVSLLDSTEQCKRELDEVWTCDNVSRWYWVRTVKYCFSDERISIKVDFALNVPIRILPTVVNTCAGNFFLRS